MILNFMINGIDEFQPSRQSGSLAAGQPGTKFWPKGPAGKKNFHNLSTINQLGRSRCE